jgi:hypothetical protein
MIMKKAEIKVGGLYTSRISGKFVIVRVDAIRESQRMGGTGYDGRIKYRDTVVYDVTNLTTKRKIVFRSAAKFRHPASDNGMQKHEAKPRIERDHHARPIENQNGETLLACKVVINYIWYITYRKVKEGVYILKHYRLHSVRDSCPACKSEHRLIELPGPKRIVNQAVIDGVTYSVVNPKNIFSYNEE